MDLINIYSVIDTFQEVMNKYSSYTFYGVI